jgi:hypothetical protein
VGLGFVSPLRHDTLTHFWATGHPSPTRERVVADEDTQVGQQVPLASAVSCTERLGHRAAGEIVRAHARHVKRWQDGDMRLRWAAAGMLTAAEQFRRVKGYRQLLQLATALRHAIGAEDTSRVAVTA